MVKYEQGIGGSIMKKTTRTILAAGPNRGVTEDHDGEDAREHSGSQSISIHRKPNHISLLRAGAYLG